MMASFTCIDISLDFILIAPVKWLPDDNSSPEIIYKPFISFISLEVTREQTRLACEAACRSKYFLVPKKLSHQLA